MNLYHKTALIITFVQPFTCMSMHNELKIFLGPLSLKIEKPSTRLQLTHTAYLQIQNNAITQLKTIYSPEHPVIRKHEEAIIQRAKEQEKQKIAQLIAENEQTKAEMEQIKAEMDRIIKKVQELTIMAETPSQPVNNQPQKRVSPQDDTYGNAFQQLCKLCKVKKKVASKKNGVCHKLGCICDDIYNCVYNNRLPIVNFNQKKHALYGSVNGTWSFIFLPCTGELKIVNTPYDDLAQTAQCSIKNCRYYATTEADSCVIMCTCSLKKNPMHNHPTLSDQSTEHANNTKI